MDKPPTKLIGPPIENRVSRIWPVRPRWKRMFWKYTYHLGWAWVSDGKGGSRPQVTREFRWETWVLGVIVAVVIAVGLAFMFHLLHF